MKPGDLPTIVPLFPLAEPLLLPGTVVPLHVFEPGEHNLIQDALAAKGYVGIVQPLEEVLDEDGEPTLYGVGCLGHIGEWQEGEEEDELLVLVGGVVRFRVVEEHVCDRGYRQAVIDFGEFLDDLEEVEEDLGFTTLRDLVRKRIEANRAEFDLSIMDGMAGTEIVTAIAHAIALSTAERQMLMETPSLKGLEGVLLQLMAGPGGQPSFDLPISLPS